MRFHGRLTKIRLTSNNLGFGPCPEPEDEIEQRLTVTAGGRVWLSRYLFGTDGSKPALKGRETFSVSAEDAGRIMDAVAAYFEPDPDIPFATDVGSWDLTLTDSDGLEYRASGPLCHDLSGTDGGLSDLIRSGLRRTDLFAFDGNPDAITKLEVRYHRLTGTRPGALPPDDSFACATRDYYESLILDRAAETLEHICEIGPGCRVARVYRIEGGVSSFLDDQGADILSHAGEDPEDAIADPLETRDYVISIRTKNGVARSVAGTFDRDGLPDDWPRFIESVYDFIRSCGQGELFDGKLYKRGKRRASDLIFCRVGFEDGGPFYTYLADTDDYEAGDLVVVPAGRDDREAVARVESVEYRQPEDAPFPLGKTKHILRKYGKDVR